jgi:hypothetical protein
MNNTDNNKEKRADFAALCAWLITCATMAYIAYSEFGQDFRGYYAAAKVLLAGGNPYDYYQVAPILFETTGRIGNNPFYYPLWFGWFAAPLSLLPYQAARAVWMAVNLVVWIVGLIRLRGLLDWPRKGWRTWCLNLLATFIFAWSTWKFEQTGILLFAITVEIVIAHKRQRWNRMGILLAAASIKPNIMLIPVGILCLWLIRNKIYRPVILMTVLLAGLVLLTTILTPGWYQPLLQPNFGQGLTEVLDGPDKTTGIRLNTTLLDWLKVLQIPDDIAFIIYGLAIAISLFVIGKLVWNSKSVLEVTVVALLVNFAITPYALQYDFAPMTVVLFWGLALAVYAESVKIPALLIAFVASVLIWERPISDGYWIVIGLCALVIWSIRLNKDTQLPERFV